MNAGMSRPLKGLPSLVNIVGVGPRQRGDYWLPHLLGDGGHGFKVSWGAGGEPGLYYVHTQALQLPGDLQLLRRGHPGPGGLLAVPERCVEYSNLFLCHFYSSPFCLWRVGLTAVRLTFEPKAGIRRTQTAGRGFATTPPCGRSTCFASISHLCHPELNKKPVPQRDGTLSRGTTLIPRLCRGARRFNGACRPALLASGQKKP